MKKDNYVFHKEDLKVGAKIGKWTLIAQTKNKYNRTAWDCECECGKRQIITPYHLYAGLNMQCGHCSSVALGKRTKHGYSHTKLYQVWKGMRDRCSSNSKKSYPYYKAKGIKVCSEWDDYTKFRSWSLENGYKDGLSIDRIDSSKGYSPDNCRWVTIYEQSLNKPSMRTVFYKGEQRKLAELAVQNGKNPRLVRERIDNGWSIEDALSIEPDIKRRPLKYRR